MEKKNIYIVLAFILGISLSFSAGYYFGIKKGTSLTINYLDTIEKKLNFEDPLKTLNSGVVQDIGTKENLTGTIEKQKEFLGIFDFESDDSLQKFVTSTKSFNDKGYIPKNLEKISSEFILDLKGGSQTLRKEANEALQKMGEKFFEDKKDKIKVVSAYRSYNYQVGIKKGGCPDSLCAKAGFSEHQTGLVVDLWSASSENVWKNDKSLQNYFSWLKQNAHNFGFHNTYQRGIEIDGYVVEPWHWRYLGVELATYLKENNLTIAEYYKNLENGLWQRKID
ncbi:hypothetical protein DLH72_00635 [Candidatus Gracilibacteria bacterium]|nr:MAG: hypothetical protein DLH72_00635 [Candidatus Gracilibacteria bacterium]